MAGSRSDRILIAAFVVGVVALGCSPAASPSLSAAVPSAVASAAVPSEVAPSAAPSLSAAPAVSPLASSGSIVLDRTGSIGCDSIGVDYKSATIKIDAASDPDVWAQTDTGKKIAVSWTDGFTATGESPVVIRGPKGEEVARDGTVIDVPAATRLAGYFVCLGPDELYVLETDPQ
jgi:hypothetical protein